MKYAFFIIGLIAIGVAFYQPSEVSKDVLTSDQTIFDFGLAEDTTATIQCNVVNATNRTVALLDPLLSCGCTSAVLSTHVLAPKSSANLNVVVDLHGQNGMKLVTVTVPSEKWEDSVKFSFKFFVKSEFRKFLQVGEFNHKNPPPLINEFRSFDRMPYRIENVINEKDLISTYTVTKHGRDFQTLSISLNELPVGPFSTTITVETTDAERPLKSFAVSGDALAPVISKPQACSFGVGRPNTELVSAVTIMSTGGKPFSISDVKTSDKRVSVEFDRNKTGLVHEISINGRFDTIGEISGTLTVLVSDSETSSIKVPYFALIKN